MTASAARLDAGPPGFVRLAGHPVRWRLLRELGRSDRQVRELCALVGRPQSLVSYHLGRLRSHGLVAMRRSAADGRDAYYSLDLAHCAALLSAAGGALHPGLGPVPPPTPRPRTRGVRPRVLFLCSGNSARSQIAEALLEHRARGAVEARSAGSRPKPLHPNAVRVMRERGIDIAGRRSKPIGELADQRFDHVVSLCDRVREVCPELLGRPAPIHWSIPDPARTGDTDAATYPAFRATADELAARITFLLALIAHPEEATRS